MQFLNLAANDRCHLIKQDGDISVYQADVPKLGVVIIKQYALATRRARLSFRSKQKNITPLFANRLGFLPELFYVGLTGDHKHGHCVYQFLPGKDLRKIDWSSISESMLTLLAQQIASQLCVLHNKGWVHGDFKFANIMLVDLEAKGAQVLKNAQVPKTYFIDMESAKKIKSFLFFKNSRKQRARDVARFIMDAEEKSAHRLGVLFWELIQSQLPEQEKTAFSKAVKEWVNVFSVRHAKKYGSSVTLNYL